MILRKLNTNLIKRSLTTISSPLWKIQDKLNPILSDFGKYRLPLRFPDYSTSNVVRNTRQPNYCTLFDVSHMAVIDLTFNNKDMLLTDIRNKLPLILEDLYPINTDVLKTNKSLLSVMLDDNGNVLDDFIVSNVDNKKYRFIVNGNTYSEFFSYFYDIVGDNNVDYKLEKKEKIILSIQGDKSQSVLEELFNIELDNIYFMEGLTIAKDIEINRCGYTGTDGFELYLDLDIGIHIYESLLDKSLSDSYIQLGGLLERDILRMEAGLYLSGQDFGYDIPIHFKETNLDFIIGKKRRRDLKFKGGNKINKPIQYQRVGFTSNRPIIEGKVYSNNEEVGFITSGTKSYTLNKFIGMGYVKKTDNLYYKNKNKNIILNIENLPFIQPTYYRKTNIK